MGKLPSGWLDYTPIGKRIEGTRFICFKVPLQWDQRVYPEETRCSPDSVMEQIPQLGLVIDLTDTDRYYSPRSFTNNGIAYQKIQLQGHVLPTSRSHKFFRDTVNNYLAESVDSDKLIGVHCTHGCNRTGLMICSYLIREGKLSPDEAIQAFEVSRGHEMRRENYLDAIRKTKTFEESQRKTPPSVSKPQMRNKIKNIPTSLIRQAAEDFGSTTRNYRPSNTFDPPWVRSNHQETTTSAANSSGSHSDPSTQHRENTTTSNWRNNERDIAHTSTSNWRDNPRDGAHSHTSTSNWRDNQRYGARKPDNRRERGSRVYDQSPYRKWQANGDDRL